MFNSLSYFQQLVNYFMKIFELDNSVQNQRLHFAVLFRTVHLHQQSSLHSTCTSSHLCTAHLYQQPSLHSAPAKYTCTVHLKSTPAQYSCTIILHSALASVAISAQNICTSSHLCTVHLKITPAQYSCTTSLQSIPAEYTYAVHLHSTPAREVKLPCFISKRSYEPPKYLFLETTIHVQLQEFISVKLAHLLFQCSTY